MTKITMPANLDSLTELGRTLTEGSLFVHYDNGIIGVEARRTTRWDWYQNDAESTREIAKQYEEWGTFIVF